MIQKGFIFIWLYSPWRVFRVFQFLLSIFLLIRRQPSLFGMKPLSPEQLCATIQQLGSSFIKLAQVLATRADFFDEHYLRELRYLHDRIAPMPERDLLRVFRRAFGRGEIFSWFESEPLASASIGQVHRARLASSDQLVAVKMRRNNIAFQVRQDIRILALFHSFFSPFFAHYTRHSIESVLIAFRTMILEEVNMSRELHNLQRFSKTYADSGIRFPVAFAELSSEDALVMSFEQGYRFDDRENLARLNISYSKLMDQLVHFYTEQMLVQGYFHADPHPGNLFVNEAGELVLLDFGMVTRIPRRTRIATIQLVQAANDSDFERLIFAARRLGIITDDAPEEQLQDLVEQLFVIFNDDSLSAGSMQQLATDILLSMRNMPFKLPQETIYIMRAGAIIEGLGTTYINNFNGIKDILPILRRYLARSLEREEIWDRVAREAKQLPMTLVRTQKVIELLHEGELALHLHPTDREILHRRFERTLRRKLIGVALHLSGWGLILVEKLSLSGGSLWAMLLSGQMSVGFVAALIMLFASLYYLLQSSR